MTRRVTAVLSGGGVKAAAHLGAVVAAMLAQGLAPGEILERVRVVRRHDVARLRAAGLVQGLFATALLHAEPLQRTIARLVSATTFAELTVPLTVTAADLDTSEVVVFGPGGEDAPLHEALFAACALPPWYPPVVMNGRRLADGGIRGVLPLAVAARFECDLVMAVDAGPGTDAAPASGRLAPPPFVRAFTDVMHVMMSANTELSVALWRATPQRAPLLYVRPETERGATFAMGQFARYERAGYEAARTAINDRTI